MLTLQALQLSKNQLCKLLESNDLDCVDEMVLLLLVYNWLEERKLSKEERDEILSHVRLDLIPLEIIWNKVNKLCIGKEKLFTEEKLRNLTVQAGNTRQMGSSNKRTGNYAKLYSLESFRRDEFVKCPNGSVLIQSLFGSDQIDIKTGFVEIEGLKVHLTCQRYLKRLENCLKVGVHWEKKDEAASNLNPPLTKQIRVQVFGSNGEALTRTLPNYCPQSTNEKISVLELEFPANIFMDNQFLVVRATVIKP